MKKKRAPAAPKITASSFADFPPHWQRRLLRLGVQVTPDAEAATEQGYLVCAPADQPTPFRDNLFGSCTVCGSRIMWRFHAPAQLERICMECWPFVVVEAKD